MVYEKSIKKLDEGDQRDNTASREFALHVINPSSISGISYNPSRGQIDRTPVGH